MDFITAQSLPLQFHLYTLMPLILWRMCFFRILLYLNRFNIKQFVLRIKGSELLELLFYFIGIELLVINFIVILIQFLNLYCLL